MPPNSAAACAAWAAGDAAARERWHAYHLIGDVLRCEDLASAPAQTAAFLAAPARCAWPTSRPCWRRSRCGRGAGAAPSAGLLPVAMAAGVMALASVLVVTLGPGGGVAGADAGRARPAVPMAVRRRRRRSPVPKWRRRAARVVRDAQLDRYLRAHRDYATALPGSLPGGSGRSIATVSLDR